MTDNCAGLKRKTMTDTHSEYVTRAKALRYSAMVEAWIRAWGVNDDDCAKCSFPHSPHLLCNSAPFGRVRFGGTDYTTSLSNVVWWVGFMEAYAPLGAFHWKDERFFRRTPEGVEVTFFTRHNNTPQRSVWTIPSNEWGSIVSAMKEQSDG